MGITHAEGTFKTVDGLELYEQWFVPDSEVKGTVVVVHGWAEHCGRYTHLAAALNENGYAVGMYDQRNHGKSAPDRPKGRIRKFDELWDDFEVFLERARQRNEGKPLFVFAHSMGGEVLVSYTIARQLDADGLLISGATMQISKEVSPLMVKMAGVVSKILPNVNTIVLDGDAISRDPEMVKLYNSDPLNYRGGVPALAGAEMNRIVKYIQANMEKIDVPILIMHGSADRLSDPQGSRDLYVRAKSADKTLKMYEGLYHEILNEPEKNEVMADMVQWLDAHLN